MVVSSLLRGDGYIELDAGQPIAGLGQCYLHLEVTLRKTCPVNSTATKQHKRKMALRTSTSHDRLRLGNMVVKPGAVTW
jgi:hypothetical protein